MPKQYTKAQLKAAHKELKRLNAFIAKHGTATPGEFAITENTKNTEAFGERYVFIALDKENSEMRKLLKAIRYGAQGRGKARFIKAKNLWSIKASALEGTVFGS